MGQFKQDGVNFNIESNMFPNEKPHSVDGKLITLNGWTDLGPGETASKIINAVEID